MLQLVPKGFLVFLILLTVLLGKTEIKYDYYKAPKSYYGPYQYVVNNSGWSAGLYFSRDGKSCISLEYISHSYSAGQGGPTVERYVVKNPDKHEQVDRFSFVDGKLEVNRLTFYRTKKPKELKEP